MIIEDNNLSPAAARLARAVRLEPGHLLVEVEHRREGVLRERPRKGASGARAGARRGAARCGDAQSLGCTTLSEAASNPQQNGVLTTAYNDAIHRRRTRRNALDYAGLGAGALRVGERRLGAPRQRHELRHLPTGAEGDRGMLASDEQALVLLVAHVDFPLPPRINVHGHAIK